MNDDATKQAVVLSMLNMYMHTAMHAVNSPCNSILKEQLFQFEECYVFEYSVLSCYNLCGYCPLLLITSPSHGYGAFILGKWEAAAIQMRSITTSSLTL